MHVHKNVIHNSQLYKQPINVNCPLEEKIQYSEDEAKGLK